MPRFNVAWKMRGTAVVEADDATEAESIVEETFENFDHTMVDELEVNFCSAESEGVVGDD